MELQKITHLLPPIDSLESAPTSVCSEAQDVCYSVYQVVYTGLYTFNIFKEIAAWIQRETSVSVYKLLQTSKTLKTWKLS